MTIRIKVKAQPTKMEKISKTRTLRGKVKTRARARDKAATG